MWKKYVALLLGVFISSALAYLAVYFENYKGIWSLKFAENGTLVNDLLVPLTDARVITYGFFMIAVVLFGLWLLDDRGYENSGLPKINSKY